MKEYKKFQILKNYILSVVLVTFVLQFNACSSYKEADEIIATKQDSLPQTIDYNLHVRPILSDKCFNCHGPDKNKMQGDLQLHTFELATKKTDGHNGIVPGNLSSSEVVRRILSNDPEKIMPLPSSNLVLTELEKATLTKWIKQGAKYKPHWAFIKPEKSDIPKVKTPQWIQNPIDNYILSRLEKEGMQPSEKAAKEKLARRVYIDFTGMAPTIPQLDTFLGDNSPKAYENLVDKLLAKPQYGERMANEWMDVARYADSHGYQDDGESEMWPWRDWVINAFNKNLPYNQFITYQIAGDLLPMATKEQVIATGFNRNHMINAEGGIIDEEFRTEYVLDRVGTTAKAFLALTAECARCHDHKYDPISQKEFYQLSTFFNQLEEQGKGNLYENSTGPTMLLTDDKTDEKLAFIREKIETQEKKVAEVKAKSGSNIQKVKDELLLDNSIDDDFNKHLVANFSFDNTKPNDSTILNLANKANSGKLSKTTRFVEGKFGKALVIDGEDRTAFPNQIYNFERNEPFAVSMWINSPKFSAKGFTLLANCAATYHGFRGYEFLLIANKLHVRISSSWPSNALQVVSIDSISSKKWTHVAFSYDGSSKAEGISLFVNGKKTNAEITHNELYRTIKTRTVDTDRAAYIKLSEIKKSRKLIRIEEQMLRQLYFKAYYSKQHNFSIGGRSDQGITPFFDGKIDDLKMYDKALTTLELAADYQNKPISELIKTADSKMLNELYSDYKNADLIIQNTSLAALRAQENAIILPLQELKVMKDRPKIRATFVLNRGVFDAPTDTVQPGAINSVLPYENLPKNRLGLAQWLTTPKNPMTARVAVNRYWQMIFGIGLVTTSADFGNQGNMPSHPELLDWLSIQFVNSGWNVKSLLKLMVMSATYQQSSTITPEKYAKDPQNLLYGRAMRYRYQYEIIRDNTLVASELMNNQVGGRSFKPYQPAGLWEEKSESPVNNYYQEDKAPEIYRRSMYICLKRTSPHPAFNAFDGPERFTCQVKRQSTNTPIQALTSLNDPQFMEAARVLAQKEMAVKSDLKTKISSAFRKMLSRNPNEKELFILTKVYDSEKEKFTKSPQKADEILKAGVYESDVKLPKIQTAALAMVVHTIMNLDEAVSRE